MARSPSNCLQQHNIPKNKIPADLAKVLSKTSTTAKARKEAEKAVNHHINTLKKTRDSYVIQYKDAVKKIKAQTISGLPAGKFTSRETDPKNELADFVPDPIKRLRNNLIQRFGSFQGAVRNKILSSSTIDVADEEVYADFETNFYPDFVSNLEKIFKIKGRHDFRYEDFLQYFPERSLTGFSDKETSNKIIFRKSKLKGYPARTKANAQSSDATLAFALDFNSAGERLTRKEVLKAKKQIIKIPVAGGVITEAAVNGLAKRLIDGNIHSLNIAGNGLQTLHKMDKTYTQARADAFVDELLSRVVAVPGVNITSIRSGGQSGFDEAGAKAGAKLGIPTTILAPGDLRFYDGKKNVVNNEKAFKARFPKITESNADYSAPTPIKYVHEDGSPVVDNNGNQITSMLDPAMQAAIATTAYEWLATKGVGALDQDGRSIKSLLNIQDNDAPVSEHAIDMLEDTGVHGITLAQKLGRTIAGRLAIQPGDNADTLARERLEMSLGFMAIGTLEQMGKLERQQVYTGSYSQGTTIPKNAKPFGLKGLRENHPVPREQVFYDPATAGKTRNQGKPTTKLFRLVTENFDEEGYREAPTWLEDPIELMAAAPHAFTKLYDNNQDTTLLSWDKVSLPEVMQIGFSTKFVVTEKQRDNLQAYVDLPQEENTHTMNVFNSLSEDNIETMVGIVDPLTKLSSRKKNINGLNRSLKREIAAIKLHKDITDKRVEDGLSPDFYLPSIFQANQRMFQHGQISPQNSKLHRALYGPKAWTVQITTSNKEHMDRFYEAIAYSFDMESGKLGGAKKQRTKVKAFLKQPEIKHALDILTAFRHSTDGVMSLEDQAIVMHAVELGENKTHSLKGLIEYSRYLEFLDIKKRGEKFTTNITKEVDGISNGPIIGTIQLIPNSANMLRIAATLNMGGFGFGRDFENIDEKLQDKFLNDAYKRMGHQWALRNLALKKAFVEEGQTQQLEIMDALENILGKFTDKYGFVEKLLRNLSKPRTMQTIYGAGNTKQMNIFAESDVINEGIYKGLEKIIQQYLEGKDLEKIPQKLDTFFKDVSTLSGWRYKGLDSYIKVDGTLNIDALRNFYLSEWEKTKLLENIEGTYGKAMIEAIENSFAGIIKARKPFTDAVQASVTIYNSLLSLKVKAVQAEHRLDRTNEHPERLTKKEMNDILDSLLFIYPMIDTPMSEEDGTGRLPMSTPGRRDETTQYNDTNVHPTAEVNVAFAPDTVEGLKGYVSSIPYLEPTSASPMVISIQMQDAMIANGLMGSGIGFLNNHDGFTHSILDGDLVGEETNRIFYEAMLNYDMGKSMYEMYHRTLTGAADIMANMDVDASIVFDTMLKDGIVSTDMLQQFFPKMDTKQFAYDALKTKGDIPNFVKVRNAIDAFVRSKFKTSEQKLKFTKNIFTIINSDARNMSEEVTTNKRAFMESVSYMSQYSNNGFGYAVPGGGGFHADIVSGGNLDVNRATVTSQDQRNTGKIVNQISKTMDELIESTKLKSSKDLDISSKIEDYPQGAVEIDSQNVVEMYDTMSDIDNETPIGTKDSEEHQSYLRGLLNDLMGQVMRPVEMYQNTHTDPNLETGGLYQLRDDGNKIWIQTQADTGHPQPGLLGHGLRLPTAQVYAHELIHHVTYSALQNNPRLRQLVIKVHEATRAAFEDYYGENAFRVFLDDPNADITDSALEFEVKAAKERYDYIFNSVTQEDRSNSGLDEFITFGVTNENFMKALATVELTQEQLGRGKWDKVFEKNIQKTVQNIFEKIMNFVNGIFKQERSSIKADKQVRNLVDALVKVNNHKKGAVMELAIAAEEKATALGGVADRMILRSAAKTRLGQLVKVGKLLPEYNNFLSTKLRELLTWFEDGNYGLISSIITEMQGNTERVQPLHTLSTRRQHVIDAAKNSIAQSTRDSVLSWFKNGEPTVAQKVALTKAGLKTDMSSLMQHSSLAAIRTFLTDDSALYDQIQSIEAKINAAPEYQPAYNFIVNAANSLAYYMVTSRARSGDVSFMNATNIASLNNTEFANTITIDQVINLIPLVDQLASLKALTYVDRKAKRQLADLMDSDLDAVENVLEMHNSIKADALRDSFNDNPVLMQKGYTKAITNARVKYVQGTKDDQAHYENNGYVMQKSPIQRDPKDLVQEDIMMFKANLGTVNDQQSGILSFSNNAGMGAGPYKIQLQIGNDMTATQESRRATIKMRKSMDAKIAAMVKGPVVHQSNDPYNYMIPQFDVHGRMDSARYIMAESTKDAVLEQHHNFDDVMSAMASQVIDKKFTAIINNELVEALKEMHENDFEKNPGLYVEISANSKDPELQEIYHMIPPKAQAHIQKIWKAPKMYVSKDVLTLAFGQRKFSITDTFGKDAKERNIIEKGLVAALTLVLGWDNPFSKSEIKTVRGRAITRAKNIEDVMAQFTQIGKNNIVVRSGIVTKGNYLSNLAYLKSKGMSAYDITMRTQEALKGALKYQEDKKALDAAKNTLTVTERKYARTQLATDAVIIKNLNRLITKLENEISLNTSTHLIEAGLMPDVVDDVDTGSVQSPYKHGVPALIDKGFDLLPGEKLERVGRTIFMTEDTEGYKMLNNAVKLTDYVARFALYHFYVEQGMEHQKAMDAVIAEFINFDLPTHKMIEYANRIGLVWFSKYQLRILKQIKNLVRDKPFTSIATFLLTAMTGGDHVMNSIPFITKDAGMMFGDPFSTASDSVGGILYADLLTSVAP